MFQCTREMIYVKSLAQSKRSEYTYNSLKENQGKTHKWLSFFFLSLSLSVESACKVCELNNFPKTVCSNSSFGAYKSDFIWSRVFTQMTELEILGIDHLI